MRKTVEVKPLTERLMVVSNPKHPHYGCTGYLTGEVISVCGSPMGKIRAESCKHLGEGFFVERGDVSEV